MQGTFDQYGIEHIELNSLADLDRQMLSPSSPNPFSHQGRRGTNTILPFYAPSPHLGEAGLFHSSNLLKLERKQGLIFRSFI